MKAKGRQEIQLAEQDGWAAREPGFPVQTETPAAFQPRTEYCLDNLQLVHMS